MKQDVEASVRVPAQANPPDHQSITAIKSNKFPTGYHRTRGQHMLCSLGFILQLRELLKILSPSPNPDFTPLDSPQHYPTHTRHDVFGPTSSIANSPYPSRKFARTTYLGNNLAAPYSGVDLADIRFPGSGYYSNCMVGYCSCDGRDNKPYSPVDQGRATGSATAHEAEV